MKDVLVFVPGLLGTELHDAEGKVWPGSLFNGLLGFDDAHFARLMKPNLTVGPIIEWAAGVVNIYGKWMTAFRSLRRNGVPLFSDAANPATLYTVPYDWRLSLESSAAERLAPVIKTISTKFGPDVGIHIVAHSLGGLLTRYYLQSGQFDNDPGFSSIKSFFTFGTPHNGAPVALAAALGIHKTNFMSLEQSRTLANDLRYPALYQTFPLFDAPVIWKRIAQGRLDPITLGDRAFATQKLKLNPANLDRAMALRKVLDGRPIPPSIRCFLMVGTRFQTITHFIWDGSSAAKIETPDAGDGTVSIPGAYLPTQQVQFTGELHVDLIKSDLARVTFQQLLGADGLAALVAGEVALTVRDLEVATERDVHLRIYSSASGLPDFDARLVWQRGTLPAGQAAIADKDFKPVGSPAPVPIKFSGPRADAIAVKLTAPALTGIYRIALEEAGKTFAVSELFVVSPP